MGELHTSKTDKIEYLNIIKKQKQIIDNVLKQFSKNTTYFYTEAPLEFKKIVLETDNYSSSVIVQYVNDYIPIKYSNVSLCDRETSRCDNEYSDDILSIFDINPEIKCIIVQIGLLHVPEVKRLINKKQSTINIIIINTLSIEQLIPIVPQLTSNMSMRELLINEPSYELPGETFKANILYNEDGEIYEDIDDEVREPITIGDEVKADELPRETFKVNILYNKDGYKIYECPICKGTSGILAPLNPEDTGLFTHNINCPNKDKIPIEPPSRPPDAPPVGHQTPQPSK